MKNWNFIQKTISSSEIKTSVKIENLEKNRKHVCEIQSFFVQVFVKNLNSRQKLKLRPKIHVFVKKSKFSWKIEISYKKTNHRQKSKSKIFTCLWNWIIFYFVFLNFFAQKKCEKMLTKRFSNFEVAFHFVWTFFLLKFFSLKNIF